MENEIKNLYSTILERKISGENRSYTNYLFTQGINKILKKVGEECTEVIISSKESNKEEQVNEICDLTYHILVLMAELNIPLENIKNELKKRSERINNFKGERKAIKEY
ncbi:MULTISPECIES: phosphoribosyl-ATP diphosphatase [Clostridium]|uniref:Phosphoribosyl-ATP pyrophosphatase n=1 Tax=Clostridium aquiflavi TaxID=3073603 RepID=A0ABU1EH09_9CLOT|nr:MULTISPECIES: phosphoribosyl-ATP diphosphatase [unclassified Clostridium]MDR5587662.1 phosphoribosyl-ATP diphosphatase [Clostridium sp. 5N-1]NFG63315.1 phosphoribosyl-ATP diphosphatase [Clostridium botulinum]NFQ08586.1 phosphoribosyl-ATP diphosphatase [Clostridium botulinum]